MGPVDSRWASLKDLGRRELTALLPLAVLIIALGLFPGLALGLMDTTLAEMTAQFQ